MTRRRVAEVLALAFALVVGSGGAVAQSGRAPLAVRLAPTHGSGVAARALLTPADDLTSIRISLSRGSGTYLPSLLRGTCGAYAGRSAVPLSTLAAGSPSKTLVDLPFAVLTAGDYVLDLHVAGGTVDDLFNPATSVACGVIGASAAAPSPTAVPAVVAPVAGVGPIDGGGGAWTVAAVGSLATAFLVAGLRLHRPRVYPRSRIVRRRYRELLS